MAMVTLDELIRSVQQDAPTPLEQLSAASETAAVLGELGDSLLNHFVDRCRRSGHTWAEIGEHLGVTRQAAQKRFVPSIGEVTFERFTMRARAALEQARGIAVDMGHNYVGTEHLLLSLFQVDGGLAFEALARLGITRAMVEKQVASRTELTTTGSMYNPGFTPRAAKALAEAVNEALDLGHNYIGTEHLLLGLFRGQDSLAKTVLEELGARADAVRAIVVEMLSGYVDAQQAPAPAPRKAAPRSKTAPAKKTAPRKKA